MAAEEFEPIGDGYQQRLRSYLEIAWRRKGCFVLTFICGLALTVVVVLALPAKYRSTGTILVESPQVPDNFVQSGAPVPSYVDKRIDTIRQRILTQKNLLSIASEYDLYPDMDPAAPSEIVDKMQQAIDIESVSSLTDKTRQGPSTIAVTVAFEHGDARTAQDVTNELVTRFLGENTRTRNQSVSETKDFITQQTQDLNARVEQVAAALAAYRKQNNDLLPERAEAYARRTEELEDAQRSLDASMRLLQSNRTTIASQLAAFTKKKTGDDTIVEEIRTTRSDLREARSKFTASHPEVRRLEKKLATLTAALNSAPPKSADSQNDAVQDADPLYAQLQYQLSGVDDQIKLLTQQKTDVQREAQKLRQLSSQIPAISKGLADLQRQYDDAVSQFQQMTAKEMQAQLSAKLETEQMSDRFTLIDPPNLPDLPAKPNRKLLAAGGGGLSIFLGIAVIILADFLDSGIRRKRQLRRYFSDKIPIVTVPYVANARDRIWGTLKAASVALVVAAAVLAAGFSLQARYQPFNALWQKSMQQVGSKANALEAP